MTEPLSCARCGTGVAAGARFCGSCGTPAPEPGAGAQGPTAPASATAPTWLVPEPPAAAGFGPPAGPAASWPPPGAAPSGPQPGPPQQAGDWSAQQPPTGGWNAPQLPTGGWNAQPQPTGGWNAPPPQGGPAAPRLRDWARQHGLTPERFTSGDWAGAVIAALGGIGAMLVLAAIALLLFGVADFPVISSGQVIAGVAMAVALAAGGSVDIDGVSGLGVDGAASLSLVPLTLTAVGFGVMATVFVRRLRTRGAQHVPDVALQAVRVWLVLLGGLLVVCLVGRFQVGDGLSSSTAAFGLPGLHVAAGIASTLFFGSCWLAFVLVVATLWRLPALLPPRVRGWRDRAGGPAAGAAVAIALSCAAAVVFVIIEAATSDGFVLPGSRAPGAAIGMLLLLGPNLLLATFGFAVGVPLTVTPSIPFLSSRSSSNGTSVSLLDVTDQDPIFWLVPLATAIAIVVGGLVAALHAPSPDEARRSFWRVGLALGGLLLVIAVSTSASGSAGAGDLFGGFGAHLDIVIAPLFGIFWGALGGWIGALLAPGMPAGIIGRIRAHADRARQRAYYGQPAQPGPFPGGPHPAGPGPGGSA